MKNSKMTKPEIEDEYDGLPLAATSVAADIRDLSILFIAPPKFGKTSTLAAFPDTLVLAFEAGHKFTNCFKIVIDAWDKCKFWEEEDGTMHMSAVEAFARIVKAKPGRFKFIVIDTVDAMADMSLKYHLELYGASHPQDLGDYGKGYALCIGDPVMKLINAVIKTGRGFGFITHEEHKEIKVKGKEPYHKKESSMPGSISKKLYPQADIILHGEFGIIQEGNIHADRIIHTGGSNEILSGSRCKNFPPSFILPEDEQERFELMNSFLTSPKLCKEKYGEFNRAYVKTN